MSKKGVMVDLYKLRAEHSDRQIADAGLVKDLIDNLIDYGARLASAEARIVELEGQLGAKGTDAGTGVHERNGASPVSPGGRVDGDKGALDRVEERAET